MKMKISSQFALTTLESYMENVENGNISLCERFATILYANVWDTVLLKEEIVEMANKNRTAVLSIYVPSVNEQDLNEAYNIQSSKSRFALPIQQKDDWDIEHLNSLILNDIEHPQSIILLLENPYTSKEGKVQEEIIRLMETFSFRGKEFGKNIHIFAIQQRTDSYTSEVETYCQKDAFLHMSLQGLLPKEKENMFVPYKYLKEAKEREEMNYDELSEFLHVTPRSYVNAKTLYKTFKETYDRNKFYNLFCGTVGRQATLQILENEDLFK